MGITVGTNIASLRAQRQLSRSTDSLGSIAEKLSSGQRITSASSDPAGLAVAASLNMNVRIYSQALKNINDGVSLLSIADGAISELSSLTTRIQELAEQSANGVYSGKQREAMQSEAAALSSEYSRIISSTKFNGLSLLDGSLSEGVRIQAGIGTEGSISVALTQKLARSLPSGVLTGTSSYSFLGSPDSIVSADFNNDGIADVGIATETPGYGSPARSYIYLGNGDATFKAPTSFLQAPQNYSIRAADLNKDGNSDFWTTSTSSGQILVYMGNGNGTFKAALTQVVGAGVVESTLADFNGDGHLDIASCNWDSSSGQIILGNGNGTFKAERNFSLGSGPFSLGSGDFNSDGKLDLISTDFFTGSVSVLVGNGDGTFKSRISIATDGSPFAVATYDFNKDGRSDFVTAGDSVQIFYGNGDLTFRAGQSFAGASDVELDDMNGDGVIDIISAGAKTIFFGNSNGTFQAGVTNGSSVTSLAIADYNGDGVKDFAGVSGSQLRISIGATTGGASVTTPPAIDISTARKARESLDTLAGMQRRLADERGSLGAALNQLEVAARNLSIMRQTNEIARSRISDVDIAELVAQQARELIIQKVSTSVLTSANQSPALALTLLQ